MSNMRSCPQRWHSPLEYAPGTATSLLAPGHACLPTSQNAQIQARPMTRVRSQTLQSASSLSHMPPAGKHDSRLSSRSAIAARRKSLIPP